MGLFGGAAGSWIDAARLAQQTKWTQPVTPGGAVQAIKDPNSIKNVVKGAVTGASAGKSFGPWGTVIGGIAGGAAGAINSAHAKQEELTKAATDPSAIQQPKGNMMESINALKSLQSFGSELKNIGGGA